MSWSERSDEEREAARREREARRSRRRGGGDEAPWEAIARPSNGHLERDDRAVREAAFSVAPGETEVGGETDDFEVPAGTRRVTPRAGEGSSRGGVGMRMAQRPAPPRRGRPDRPGRGGAGAGAPRGGGWPARVLLAALVVLVFAVAIFLVELFQPLHGSPHGRLTVRVPTHASAGQIGDQLARDGVISSSFFFKLRAALEGDRSKLLPGTYHLQLGMSYGAVLKILTTPPPPVPTTAITMIPGERRITFSAKLRADGVKGSYYAETRHSRLLDPTAYGAPASTPSLEGFLFPDTYQVRVPISIPRLIADQLKRFKQEFATVDTRYARAHHLTPYDVLIIASLVQAEGFSGRDMRLVASVIYNRLRDRMLLGFDSTTRYATGNFTRPLSQSELASRSPWNTRNHAGLPPTPIDNPDLQAITAAAHPPSTNYLYFVSKPCSNELAFSSDDARFQHDVAAFDATQPMNGRPPLKRCHG